MLRLGKNSHPIHKGWSLYGSVQSCPLHVSDLKVVAELQRLDERGMHLHNSEHYAFKVENGQEFLSILNVESSCLTLRPNLSPWRFYATTADPA